MNELPKTIDADLFIIISPYGVPSIATADMSDFGYTTIGKQSITLDVPQNVDINSLKIGSLTMRKNNLMAEYQRNIEEIDDQIQSLLCIESK